MKLLKNLYSSVVLGVALIVCSGSAQAAPPVITTEDAQTVLEGIVSAPAISNTMSGMAPPGIKYRYSLTGSSEDQLSTGSLEIRRYDADTMKGDDGLYETAQDYFTRRKKAMNNAAKRSGRTGVEDIPGLGDAAFWTPDSDTLHFMSQGAYISIQIKDLKKISGADRAELDKKVSAHRKQLAEQIGQVIIPQLKKQ